MEINDFISERVISDNNATPIYVTISGSHLYGFNSGDSDIDYRGCYQLPTVEFLGLRHPPQHIKETENADIVMYELKKECELIVAGNCNVLEHLLAKPVLTSPAHRQLQDIAKSSLNLDGLYHSYKGMAEFNYKKYIKSGKKITAKKYLYVLRGLMAGICVIQQKKIEPNLNTLNKLMHFDIIDDLINIKKVCGENVEIKKNDIIETTEHIIDDLFLVIDDLWEREQKKWDWPVIHGLGEKINDDVGSWLIKRRREFLDI